MRYWGKETGKRAFSVRFYVYLAVCAPVFLFAVAKVLKDPIFSVVLGFVFPVVTGFSKDPLKGV